MARTFFKAQEVGVKRLNNSSMGNPQYEFTLYTPAETLKLKTAANAMFVYALLTDTMVGEWFNVVIQGEKRRSIVDFNRAF